MNKTFDPKDYLQWLGVDLVHAFDLAGKTTHPQSVGSGREKSAREKLRRVLPAGVGVGSGFVIDSFGNTSKQCDIILFEEQYALKFALNDDELNTYYNCENVIAVGQVKSDASIGDVRESIDNLNSVRKLKRFKIKDETEDARNGYSYRPYLGAMTVVGVKSHEYCPDTKSTDQIFTFLLCKSFKTPPQSILSAIINVCNGNKTMFPNRLLSIEGDYCFWLDATNNQNIIHFGALESTHFTKQNVEYVFGQLVTELTNFIKDGRSVRLNNSIYLPTLGGLQLKEPIWSI